MDEFESALRDYLGESLNNITLQSALLKVEIPAAMIRLYKGDGTAPRFERGLDKKLSHKNTKQRRDIANSVRSAFDEFIKGWGGGTPEWYDWSRVEMVIEHISGGQEICQSCGRPGGQHRNGCRESPVNYGHNRGI